VDGQPGRARTHQPSRHRRPALWPISWLKARLGARAPLARAASLGSGTGALERDLVRQAIVERVVGVEGLGRLRPPRAGRLAAEAGPSPAASST